MKEPEKCGRSLRRLDGDLFQIHGAMSGQNVLLINFQVNFVIQRSGPIAHPIPDCNAVCKQSDVDGGSPRLQDKPVLGLARRRFVFEECGCDIVPELVRPVGALAAHRHDQSVVFRIVADRDQNRGDVRIKEKLLRLRRKLKVEGNVDRVGLVGTFAGSRCGDLEIFKFRRHLDRLAKFTNGRLSPNAAGAVRIV